MKKEQFKTILQQRINKLQYLIDRKGEEYTVGEDNQFYNFDKAADMSGQTPEQVLWSYVLKHLVSVKDMVDSGEDFQVSTIDEKIGDIITYFVLLEGLMLRRHKEVVDTAEKEKDEVRIQLLPKDEYETMLELPPEKRIREQSNDPIGDKISGILVGFAHTFARRGGHIDLITKRQAEEEILKLLIEHTDFTIEQK